MTTTVHAVGGPPPFFRRPEVRFPLKFVLLSGLMAAAWAALAPAWPALTAATAAMVAWLSRVCGLTAVAGPGAQVAVGGQSGAFRFVVSDGCTALPLLMIFGVAVLAYPATSRQRTLGLTVGLCVLFVLNLARLVVIGWFGVYAPSQVQAVHEYWGQALGIASVGGGWFTWVWWIANASVGRAAAAPKQRRAAFARVARRVRMRRAATNVGVVCGVLTVFAAVGLRAHGVAVWGVCVRWPLSHVAPFFGLWMSWHLPEPVMDGIYGLRYALLAAVVALFLLTPATPWRVRVRGALFTAIPSVYLVQVTGGIIMLAAAGALHSMVPLQGEGPGLAGAIGSSVSSMILALHIGIPVVAWYRWTRKLTGRGRSTSP